MTTRARILLLSRLGADEQAWTAFRAAGWESRTDPEARLLKARLIKDRATRAMGAQRQALFREAADQYAEAAQGRSTYALINAASLSLLGGDAALGAERARAVLDLLEGGGHDPDTDYWLAATRAEALLLLGDTAAARRALGEAIACTPRAWEDHAVTLRQFALLLAALDADASWLDLYRPGPVLHFAGTMGMSPTEPRAAEGIAVAIESIRPSAAVGALAAGADILIAEALSARGVDLQIVLPCDARKFREESVTVAGAAWGPRFDRLLAEASGVDIVAVEAELSEAAIHLADQVAMGTAIGQATLLATRPIGLRVVAEDDQRGLRAADALWRRAGHQIVVASASRVWRAEAPRALREAELVAIAVIREAQGTSKALARKGDGSEFRFGSIADAIDKARGLVSGTAAAVACIDIGLAPDAPLRISAAATAGAGIAAPGSVVATRNAAATARLHVPGMDADLMGEIRTAFGSEEIWRLRFPEGPAS